MFCTKCGKQLDEENVKFCSGCGAETKVFREESTSVTTNPQTDAARTPKNKKAILIALCAVVVVVIAAVLIFRTSGGLSGTWVGENNTITFSRNRATIEQRVTHHADVGWSTSGVAGNRNNSRTRIAFFESVEFVRYFVPGSTHIRTYRGIVRGTYSISDGRIEFVLSGGEIIVHNFSRTENTMTIGGQRFTRQ